MTVRAWLAWYATLPPGEAGPVAPHVLDVLGQAIDAFIGQHGLWTEQRSLRAGSWSSKRRAVRGHDAALGKAIGEIEDAARRIRQGRGASEQRSGVLRAGETVASALDDPERLFSSQAPKGFRTINTVSVDTRQGYRSVHLAHAHAASVRGDVLVIGAGTETTQRRPAGLAEHLRDRYALELEPDAPFLHHSPGEWTSLHAAKDPAIPFRNVLVLHVAEPAPSEQEAFFVRMVRGLYASIAAMEAMDLPTTSVTMPVLQQHRVATPMEYQQLVGALVRGAVDWLKRSAHTDQINLCVYFGDELDAWSEAMDRTLGRTLVAAGEDSAIEELAREVSILARRQRDASLRGALGPLGELLGRLDRSSIEQIGVEGRKLAEFMVDQLMRRAGLKPGHELMKNIESSQQAGLFAPWIASYLHTLRVFGNLGVHPRLADRVYRPKQPGTADLAAALAAIRSILLFWEQEGREMPSPLRT